jgi:hypothetical protein
MTGGSRTKAGANAVGIATVGFPQHVYWAGNVE